MDPYDGSGRGRDASRRVSNSAGLDEATPESSARSAIKRQLAGLSVDEQRAKLQPPRPVLAHPVQTQGSSASTEQVKQAAQHGVSGGASALPYLERVQRAFGQHDVSGVKAHVGGQAREAVQQMGATAYATGNDVAFGESPSLHTVAHEAAHVVQQRSGVQLSGGVGRRGDAYEQHADAVADRVVEGRSAEPLLNDYAREGGSQAAVQRLVVQKDEPPSDLKEKADDRGIELKEITLLNGLKGWTAVGGSMAADVDFEEEAQKFEMKLGVYASGHSDATGSAGEMAMRASEIIKQYVNATLGIVTEAAAGEDEIAERDKQFKKTLPKLVGVPDEDKNRGIAGAVGMDPKVLLDVVEGGSLREQMTIVFNFIRSFGRVINGAKDEDLERFKGNLDGRKSRMLKRIDEMRENNERYLINETDKGAVGGQKNTRGESPKDQWKSDRSADSKDLSDDAKLTDREIAFMKLNADQLDQEKLTWEEGNNKWLINEADEWVQMARDASLPIKAGPSGTTDRIMQNRELLGASDPESCRAACLGYLLPINAHSVVEILEAAGQYPPNTRPPMSAAIYMAIEPFGNLEHLSPSKPFWDMVKKSFAAK